MSLSAQVSTLGNLITSFNARDTPSRELAMVCASSKSMEGVVMDLEQCQFVNNQNYNFWPNNNLLTHYHNGLRNQENFSYGNLNNALQPSPGFPWPLAEKKPSLEDLLSTFIMETRGRFNKDEARLDNIETHCANMSASVKSLDVTSPIFDRQL